MKLYIIIILDGANLTNTVYTMVTVYIRWMWSCLFSLFGS